MFDNSPRNSFLRAKDSTLLTIIVHTAAFAAEILRDDPQIWRLLELGTLGGIHLLCTPHENRAVVRRLQEKQVQCATVSEGVEWVEAQGSFLLHFASACGELVNGDGHARTVAKYPLWMSSSLGHTRLTCS
jgi:hypothetical protein